MGGHFYFASYSYLIQGKELKNIKPLQLDILHIRIAAFRDSIQPTA